jgi:hypothetical protein
MFTPGGKTTSCLEEQRGEQRISTLGDKIHPCETTSPPGSNFAPRGEVKNGPLELTFLVDLRVDHEGVVVADFGRKLSVQNAFPVRLKTRWKKVTKIIFWVIDPLCLSSSSALHFSDCYFRVHHPVNWDDWHLLANAMASDFSVAWQCLSKTTIGFLFQTKLHPQSLKYFVAKQEPILLIQCLQRQR